MIVGMKTLMCAALLLATSGCLQAAGDSLDACKNELEACRTKFGACKEMLKSRSDPIDPVQLGDVPLFDDSEPAGPRGH